MTAPKIAKFIDSDFSDQNQNDESADSTNLLATISKDECEHLERDSVTVVTESELK